MGKITHGYAMQGTRPSEYNTWQNIKNRCYRKSNPQFKDYGGRGIKVCDRWLHSFENFLSDMGKKPTAQHTIDRVNNEGNYEPSNCKWDTRSIQGRNNRRNKILEFNGEKMIITDWATKTGINRLTLHKRIFQHGWSIEKALTQPLMKNQHG